MAPSSFFHSGLLAFEELIKRGCFLDLLRRSWIERFHIIQFFPRDLRQVMDKMDQLRTVLRLLRSAVALRRHRREANAVMDDPEEFAVGHRLGVWRLPIRCFGIHISADRCLAAAVVRVAAGAMVGKMCTSFLQHFSGNRDRIDRISLLNWNRKMANLPRHQNFQCMGFGCGAETGAEHLVPDPPQRSEGS